MVEVISSQDIPPIDPGFIRVIIDVDGLKGKPLTDFPVSRLDKNLGLLDDEAGDIGRKPLAKWSKDGAETAVRIFQRSMEAGAYPYACVAALWICEYSKRLPPGCDTPMDMLKRSAGIATIVIATNVECNTWIYNIKDDKGMVIMGGRRETPVIH